MNTIINEDSRDTDMNTLTQKNKENKMQAQQSQQEKTRRTVGRTVVQCPMCGKILSSFDGIPFCGTIDCNLYGLAQPDSYKSRQPATDQLKEEE